MLKYTLTFGSLNSHNHLRDIKGNIAEAKAMNTCYMACGQCATTQPDSDYVDRTMAHSFERPSNIRCRYLIDTSSIREHMSGEGVPLVIFQRHRTVPSFPLTSIEQ